MTRPEMQALLSPDVEDRTTLQVSRKPLASSMPAACPASGQTNSQLSAGRCHANVCAGTGIYAPSGSMSAELSTERLRLRINR